MHLNNIYIIYLTCPVMDKNLRLYLEENNIKYKVYEHPEVFTVAESKKIKAKIPGRHTKCLFLKDENSNFYLICIMAEKRLNFNLLRKKLNLKRLFFASPEELKNELHLKPGAVSPFGMIYSDSTFLILDKGLWDAEEMGFHPNINSSTLVLTNNNLKKFYGTLGKRKEIMEL